MSKIPVSITTLREEAMILWPHEGGRTLGFSEIIVAVAKRAVKGRSGP